MLLTRRPVGGFAALALALALGSQLSACKPDLTEGAYSCKSDDQCPAGWSCDDDDRCYSKAHLSRAGTSDGAGRGHGDSDAGSADAGGRDAGGPGAAGTGEGSTGSAGLGKGGSGAGKGGAGAGNGGAGAASGGSGGSGGGPAPAPYAACGSATGCSAGSCVYGPDDAADDGVCAPSCAVDAQCPPNAGQPGVCLVGLGACLPGCASKDDCPAPLDCHDIAVAQMQTRAVCLEVESPELLGTASCTPADMATCGRGAACAFSPDTTPPGGVCSYRCDTTLSCPQGGACLEIFPSVHQCFKPCTGPAECGSLMCGTFAGQQLCIPPGWVGRTAPLPMPPMMM